MRFARCALLTFAAGAFLSAGAQAETQTATMFGGGSNNTALASLIFGPSSWSREVNVTSFNIYDGSPSTSINGVYHALLNSPFGTLKSNPDGTVTWAVESKDTYLGQRNDRFTSITVAFQGDTGKYVVQSFKDIFYPYIDGKLLTYQVHCDVNLLEGASNPVQENAQKKNGRVLLFGRVWKGEATKVILSTNLNLTANLSCE